MDFTEQYNSLPFISRNNSIVNLVLIALNNKSFSLQRYKLLMNMTEDANTKKQIGYAYNLELKHYKLFKLIYQKLTEQSVEIPKPNIKINNSLQDTLEDCLNKDLDELKLYHKIGLLSPSKQIYNALREMIIDKQRQTATLNFLYARGSLSRNPESSATNPVNVTFKLIKASKKYIDEDLRIPILDGMQNKKVQNQINTSLSDDVLEFKRQMETAAEENGLKAEKEGKKFTNYSISNNATVTYNKNNIISISILYYELIGGVRSYIRATYNFDLVTGKSLGLRDLFKPGVPYVALINSEIKKQLMANKEIYPPEAAANFKGISENQPFYLEDNNLVLFFGFNEIAPTISEIPIVKIPFSSFGTSIKPIFLS